MWNVVLALTLSFIAPSFNGGDGCAVSLMPLTDLGSVRIYGSSDGTEYFLLYEVDAHGKEGQPMSVTFTPQEGIHLLDLRTVDLVGNESCSSRINTTEVVPSLTDPTTCQWYDVAGRRYRQRPTISGVYVRVCGEERKKVVIIIK